MCTELWNRTDYLSPIPYIVNNYITEYDIIKANISVLFQKGAISEDLYRQLNNVEKLNREITIGLMERENKELSIIKAEGIKEMRKAFCEANHIKDSDVLAIKNDALYIIGKRCTGTQFGVVEFRLANSYTTYLHLNRLEVYYGYDPLTGSETIDVKGIKDETLELHRDGMITHICDVLYRLQNIGVEDAIECNARFYEVFLSRTLPLQYYREFNQRSKYRLMTSYNDYGLDYVDQTTVQCVDLSVNLNVIRSLNAILSDIHISNMNRRQR